MNFNRAPRGWGRYEGTGTTYDGHKSIPQKIGDRGMNINEEDLDRRVIERILEVPTGQWRLGESYTEFHTVLGVGYYTLKVIYKPDRSLVNLKDNSQKTGVFDIYVYIPSDIHPMYNRDIWYGEGDYNKLLDYFTKVQLIKTKEKERKRENFYNWLKQGEE